MNYITYYIPKLTLETYNDKCNFVVCKGIIPKDFSNNLDMHNSHVEIHKNRNREKYTFANINLLGRCNANCYFCLGKDIEDVLLPHNQLETLFPSWKNFEYFLNRCRE